MEFLRQYRIGALLILGVAAASITHALEADVVFRNVSPGVWTVRTFDAQERPLGAGSAVVIGPGRLVTACHVLAKASSFVIRQDNVTYGATLEYPDVERDLCQIKVANFRAAALPIAPPDSVRVGQRVYAIGSPRGVENTLSDGILSGLRAGDGADDRLLQTTASISAASSGGGLFDSEGRLLGITTFGVRDVSLGNFAVPAEFVAEIPDRAKAGIARRSQNEGGSTLPRLASARGPADPLRPGDVLEYVRIDRMTGNKSAVLYRLDRLQGDELIFNMGGKVEKADGQVVSVVSPTGGYFDSSSPPGGWARKDLKPGMRWHVDYVATSGEKSRHEMDATVLGERSVRVDGVEFKALQIAYSGWIYASYGTGAWAVATRFEATALYATALNRIVRFDAEHRRANAATTTETLELVRVLR